MTDPVSEQQFSARVASTLKALAESIHQILDTGNLEGVSKSSNPTRNKNLYFTAEELADHLGISIKTVYYRSAPKSANPWPFKVIRVGGSKRGRLRFKKSDVDEAVRKGVV